MSRWLGIIPEIKEDYIIFALCLQLTENSKQEERTKSLNVTSKTKE